MEKTDPVFQLIDNYCRSYNKANKKIYFHCYYIPLFFAAAAVYVLEHWYKWLLVLNGCWLGLVPSRHDYEQENVF